MMSGLSSADVSASVFFRFETTSARQMPKARIKKLPKCCRATYDGASGGDKTYRMDFSATDIN